MNAKMTAKMTAKMNAKKLAFRPLWDYCLLDPVINEKTKGGVVIPESARESAEDTRKSVCVAAGPGAYRDSGEFVPNPIKVGDVVYHMSRMQPFKVTLDGHHYICVSGRDCVAVEDPQP